MMTRKSIGIYPLAKSDTFLRVNSVDRFVYILQKKQQNSFERMIAED